MLSTEFHAELDSLWTEFWPATDIKPLAVIDFINLVFFIRQLELQEKERQPVSYRKAQEPIFEADQQQFKWSAFHHLDKDELYSLFNRTGGLIDFVKNIPDYKIWSGYDNGEQLIVPVPELLAKTVRLIDRIDVVNAASRTEMNNYLMNKKDAASKPRWDELPNVEIKKPVIKRQHKIKTWSTSVILLIIFLAGFATAFFYFGNRGTETVMITNSPDTSITSVDSLTAIGAINKGKKTKKIYPAKQLTGKKIKQRAKQKTIATDSINKKNLVTTKKDSNSTADSNIIH